MTTQERTEMIAALRGWRQTLAAQAQAYLENPYNRGVDFSQWTHEDCERAVVSRASAFAPACLCHEDFLVEMLMQMLPTSA